MQNYLDNKLDATPEAVFALLPVVDPTALSATLDAARVGYDVEVAQVVSHAANQPAAWSAGSAANPPAPVASLTVEAGASATVGHPNDAYAFPNASVSGGTAPYSYAWTIESRPAGSEVFFQQTNQTSPLLKPEAGGMNRNGDHVFRLTTSDSSTPALTGTDTITIIKTGTP